MGKVKKIEEARSITLEMRRGILTGRMNEVCRKGERKACDLHAYSNVILSLEKSELLDERTVNECELRARRVNASPELLTTTKRRKKKTMNVKWKKGKWERERWWCWWLGALQSAFPGSESSENLLTGSIMQDGLVHCPEWIVLIPTNLIFVTLALLHLIKPE